MWTFKAIKITLEEVQTLNLRNIQRFHFIPSAYEHPSYCSYVCMYIIYIHINSHGFGNDYHNISCECSVTGGRKIPYLNDKNNITAMYEYIINKS